MPRFNDNWTVGPHGQLEQLDEGLLTVEGEIRNAARQLSSANDRGRIDRSANSYLECHPAG